MEYKQPERVCIDRRVHYADVCKLFSDFAYFADDEAQTAFEGCLCRNQKVLFRVLGAKDFTGSFACILDLCKLTSCLIKLKTSYVDAYTHGHIECDNHEVAALFDVVHAIRTYRALAIAARKCLKTRMSAITCEHDREHWRHMINKTNRSFINAAHVLRSGLSGGVILFSEAEHKALVYADDSRP